MFIICKLAAIPPAAAEVWMVPTPDTTVPKLDIAQGTATPARVPAANTVTRSHHTTNNCFPTGVTHDVHCLFECHYFRMPIFFH